MGVPKTEPKDIPFTASGNAISYKIVIAGELINLSVVNMGNPHAVIQVNNIDKAPVERLVPLIESNFHCSYRVNVDLMQVISPRQIRLRVYERVSGESLSCGTVG